VSAAVLLAEPESSVRGFLERQLIEDGFAVVGAVGCGEALELAERARPDLALVGALPDAPSVELCRRLRAEDRNVAMIMLGQPDADESDRLRAFEGGFDDYVSKPFVYDELLARIRAVLRRASPWSNDRLHAGDVVVDRATRRVTVRDRPVPLSGKQYELLAKLATDPHRVFTRDELLRDVWGYRAASRTRTLDSHASRLRSKLDEAGGGPYVLNVWGVGYRLLRECN
jgi:DNA-binding response OmpR family regulator